ncbi:similar to An07g05810 [Aspergillus luchuensis]|uniref:Similar to An07g05810 n=1 Tax=Aspergillus kawachii TaxID=1069201 RepID=A0A146FKD8_ASPKA|nr:similar to An07g05810 [Aspergillus luchuensis]
MSALDSLTIKSGEWHDGKHRKAIPPGGGKAAQCDHADGPGPKMRSWRCSTVVKSSTLYSDRRESRGNKPGQAVH